MRECAGEGDVKYARHYQFCAVVYGSFYSSVASAPRHAAAVAGRGAARPVAGISRAQHRLRICFTFLGIQYLLPTVFTLSHIAVINQIIKVMLKY